MSRVRCVASCFKMLVVLRQTGVRTCSGLQFWHYRTSSTVPATVNRKGFAPSPGCTMLMRPTYVLARVARVHALHTLASQRALGFAALQCATCRLQPCSLQHYSLRPCSLAACSLATRSLQPWTGRRHWPEASKFILLCLLLCAVRVYGDTKINSRRTHKSRIGPVG